MPVELMKQWARLKQGEMLTQKEVMRDGIFLRVVNESDIEKIINENLTGKNTNLQNTLMLGFRPQGGSLAVSADKITKRRTRLFSQKRW